MATALIRLPALALELHLGLGSQKPILP